VVVVQVFGHAGLAADHGRVVSRHLEPILRLRFTKPAL
jgi:hypothetical protein